jgi:hypothetical protein
MRLTLVFFFLRRKHAPKSDPHAWGILDTLTWSLRLLQCFQIFDLNKSACYGKNTSAYYSRADNTNEDSLIKYVTAVKYF